jgi:hypothetical protein
MNTNMWFALYQGGPQVFAWSIVIVYFGAIAQVSDIDSTGADHEVEAYDEHRRQA